MPSQQGVTLVLARWITALSAQRAIATRGHTQTCALPAVHALSCFTEVPVEAIHRGIRGKLRQRRDRRLTKRKSAHPFRLTAAVQPNIGVFHGAPLWFLGYTVAHPSHPTLFGLFLRWKTVDFRFFQQYLEKV